MSKKAVLAAEISGMVQNEIAAIDFFVKELKSTIDNGDRITLGWLVDNWNKKHLNQKISDAGGRRIIRHIRDQGLIKRLIADRFGYFVPRNREQYENYLDMLARRLKKYSKTYQAMKLQYR